MLYLLSPLETAHQPRGTRTRFILNAVALPREKIVLITSDFDHSSKVHLDPKAIRDGNPVCTVVLHAPGYRANISLQRVWFQLVFTFRASLYLLRHVRRDDLILTMLSFPELTIANRICAQFRGARNAVDVWDIWPDALLGVHKGRLTTFFAAYCNAILRLTLRHFDKVFYVAPSFHHWTRRFGVQDTRIEFVPLGYDSDRWSPQKSPNATQAAPELRLVYVGYLADQFDLRPLLDAIDEGIPATLSVLGDGPRWLEYQSRVEGKAVTMHGHVSFGEVEAQLAASEIGVLPMASGAGAELPNKFFDYLGAGLPILVLGGSDAGAIVEQAGLGWHLQQDCEAIRTFLQSLTRDEIAKKQQNVLAQRERFSQKNLYASLLAYLETAT